MNPQLHRATVGRQKSCKLAFLNVCSLRKKLGEIQNFINYHNVDIFGIAETWLDCSISDSSIHIPHYRLFRRDRGHRPGGGIAVYSRDTLAVSRHAELESDPIENLILTLKAESGEPITLATFYLPPSTTAAVWQDLEISLNNLTLRRNNRVVAIGDFNVDMCSGHSRMHTMLQRFDLENHIRTPKRVTASTSTLIDLLLAPNSLVGTCTVIKCDISDHYAFVAKIIVATRQSERVVSRKRRVWRINWEHFNADLQDCNLEIFSKSNDVDAMISEWYAKVFTALDRHAPLQPPRKPRRRPCPWLYPELVSAVRQRNKAHRLLSRSPNDVRLREQHRTLRAAARKLDRRLRDQYFQARLQSAGKDGRKLWNTINVVTGRAKSSSPPQVPVGILSRTFGEVVHDPGRPDALCANAPAEREAPAFTEFAPVSTEDITALLQSV